MCRVFDVLYSRPRVDRCVSPVKSDTKRVKYVPDHVTHFHITADVRPRGDHELKIDLCVFALTQHYTGALLYISVRFLANHRKLRLKYKLYSVSFLLADSSGLCGLCALGAREGEAWCGTCGSLECENIG